MAMPQRDLVTIRDAEIMFRNFIGEKRQYNAQGDRNFAVKLPEREAIEMGEDGYNVKPLRRREEDTEQSYILKVKVNFGGRPPQIWMVSSGGRTLLGEGLVGILDGLDLSRVDLVFAGHKHRMDASNPNAKSAYLQSMYATIFEDDLALEYSTVPTLGAGGDGPVQQALESGSARLPFDLEGEEVD